MEQTIFVSPKNLERFKKNLDDKHLLLPSGGEKGQVLTKTEEGAEWKTIEIPEIDASNLVTREEFNQAFDWYEI